MTKNLFLILLLFFALKANAQDTLFLKITWNCSDTISYNSAFFNSAERISEQNRVLSQLQNIGYLNANITQTSSKENTKHVNIVCGDKYILTELRSGNLPVDIEKEIKFRPQDYEGKPFVLSGFNALFSQIIRSFESKGYPFASVRLDNFQFNNAEVSASIVAESGRQIVIDSLRLVGERPVSIFYLQTLLSIYPNDLYNERRVEAINQKINSTAFIQTTRSPEVTFLDDRAVVNLFLIKKNANRFDGILGFLPSGNNQRKLEFTADIKLGLFNAFKRGEIIDLNFRKLPSGNQDFRFRFNYPFLFKTPLGIDFGFELYKQDTLYVNVNSKIGINYFINAEQQISANYFKRNSDLLSTRFVQNVTVLPDFADVSTTVYGLGYGFERLDYRLNPRSGLKMNADVSAGNRVIKRNPNLPAFIYDSLKLRTTQYNLAFITDFYLPLARRATMKLAVDAANIINPNLFQNELYRIGGINSLRGFDEESILASLYAIFTAEYRYLLDTNSFLTLFVQPAYYKNESFGITDFPLGVGAGINFDTRAGIFSLYYALGKQKGNPINLQKGKIHFGFINTF